MVLSKTLPTAVDFTNSLVNYIEVTPRSPATTAEAEVPTPSGTTPSSSQPVDIGPPRTEGQAPEHSDAGASQVVPPAPSAAPTTGPSSIPLEHRSSISEQTGPRPPPPIAPKAKYTNVIPQFLLDADADEGAAEYNRANELNTRLPTPPSLPLFLTKSILNMTTPMKDDASVLVNPNHTVLNHLATSSIKGGVIATSATTRYQRKVRKGSQRLYHGTC
jgi:hypothetical protein